MDSFFFFFKHLSRRVNYQRHLLLLLVLSSNGYSQLPDFSNIVEKISPSVVSITALVEKDLEYSTELEIVPTSFDFPTLADLNYNQIEGDQHVHNGTGVILTQDGYIVTNQHIVQGGIAYIVTLENGFQYPAQFIGSDRLSDLAVLKIEAENLPIGIFSEDEQNIKAGQSVLGFGSPYSLSGSVTQGIISYVNRPLPIMGHEADYLVFIQTNLLINPGNSGGPVVNHKGEIIGINSKLLSDTGNSTGVAFAIPAEVVKNISEQLINHGYASRGWIGVAVRNVPSSSAIQLGLATPKGALVTAVSEGGPADKAGIKLNDVIVAVNEDVIRNRYDLTYRISLLNTSSRTHLIIIRDRKYHSTIVEPERIAL